MYKSLEEMLNGQLYPHQWMKLEPAVKDFLRQTFEIPKSGHVSVVGNVVETDGTTVKDLEVLTVLKLQEHLKSESTDFHELIIECVKKFKTEQNAIESKTETPAEVKGTDSGGDQEVVRSKALPKKGKRGAVPAVG